MKVCVEFQPHQRSIQVDQGSTFLTAALLAKVAVSHKCGGRGACGTCKVRICSQTPLPPPGRTEKRKLSARMIQEGYRLSCQCKITGPALVIVPEDPLKRVVRLQLEAARQEKESAQSVNTISQRKGSGEWND